MTEFEEHLLLIKQVRDSWANGGKVTIQAVASVKKGTQDLVLVTNINFTFFNALLYRWWTRD